MGRSYGHDHDGVVGFEAKRKCCSGASVRTIAFEHVNAAGELVFARAASSCANQATIAPSNPRQHDEDSEACYYHGETRIDGSADRISCLAIMSIKTPLVVEVQVILCSIILYVRWLVCGPQGAIGLERDAGANSSVRSDRLQAV